MTNGMKSELCGDSALQLFLQLLKHKTLVQF